MITVNYIKNIIKLNKNKSYYNDRLSELISFFNVTKKEIEDIDRKYGIGSLEYKVNFLYANFFKNMRGSKNIFNSYKDSSFYYSLRQLLGRPDKFNSQINIFNYIEKNLKKDSQVLDYGCCVGDFSILFAKLGFNVTVCDLDIPTLNFAMNRFKNRDLKIKKYGIKEDLLVPKMNDIKFNFIFCRDVLEHVTNPLKILNFFYYALDSNGMIYISTMNPGEKTYINGEHLRMSVEMANTKKYKEFFNNHFSLIDGMFGMYKKINA